MSYSLPSLSLRKQSFAIPQRAQVVRSCSPTLIALACGEPPCVRATLAHRFAVEPAQACGEQQQIEDNQHSEDNQQRKMRELRHQRSAQAFARVHQRIDEHRFLHDGELLERAPWIVSATEENHRRHNQTEHQADMGLLHTAAERQAARRGEKSHKQSYGRKQRSEEHTSELQSHSDLVCRLLLE